MLVFCISLSESKEPAFSLLSEMDFTLSDMYLKLADSFKYTSLISYIHSAARFFALSPTSNVQVRGLKEIMIGF